MSAKIVETKLFENQPGPLPLSAEVIPKGNSIEVVFASGSCFTEKKDSVIGFQVLVNGNVAAESKIYSHSPHEHRATIPVTVDYDLPFDIEDPECNEPACKSVKIEIVALEDTLTDENDFFNLTFIL